MLRTLNPVADVVLPEWSKTLVNHYWHIRVESRDKAKRRRYYRLIEKEKLRLAELNHNQELIKAICRYLANFNKYKKHLLEELRQNKSKQLQFEFYF